MDGMLIFAGLFSASLTAFIVESYKTLVADSGDSTVQLLSQISLQLATASNGTVFKAPTPIPFKAPTSALVCNALWFISLGLSLACALVATLLEQWAREFLHRADMRSAPVVRARMYSFLYYGMRRFRMHTVVDVIPSLLHASLICFFAGLVAFLLPVNKIIAAIVAAILAVVVCVYFVLTVLPIIQADSPYRTPLSNAVWRTVRRIIHRFLHHYPRLLPVFSVHEPWQQRWSNFFYHPVISDKVTHSALAHSSGRKERDLRALIWTFKSLSDPAELETFVEAIPDAMWGPRTRHRTYTGYFQTLRDRETEGLQLTFEIASLLRTCNDGLLSPETQQRRQTSCLKAIWALASIPSAPTLVPGRLPPSILHLPVVFTQVILGETVASYKLSADAMLHGSAINWMREYLHDCAKHLSEMGSTNLYRFRPILQYLSAHVLIHGPDISPSGEVQKLADAATSPAKFNRVAEALSSRLSHTILFRYLRRTVSLAALPYRWEDTLEMLVPDFGRFLPPGDLQEVEGILALAVPAQSRLDKSNPAPSIPPLVQELCSIWRPEQPRLIPPAIIAHLNSLKDPWVVAPGFFAGTQLDAYLWPCFTSTLQAALPSSKANEDYPCTPDDILEALWLTARWGRQRCAEYASESLLDAIITSGSPMVPVVVSAVQTAILNGIYFSDDHWRVQHQGSYSRVLSILKKHLPADFLTADTLAPAAIPFSAARISILADLLEGLTEDVVPHRSNHTIAWIAGVKPLDQIHDVYQLQFARSLRRFCEHPSLDDPLKREVMSSVVNSDIFLPYGSRTGPRTVYHYGKCVPWLQDASAVEDVRLALVEYRRVLSPSPELIMVESILEDLQARSGPLLSTQPGTSLSLPSIDPEAS
ncbi:hypothetical protein C8F01DRAFT_1373105 [Mycena amicta]|nr:hypothetical protein C8F01DRAFT_1373105 [Mycena amicta]